jgi:hypothetical protein
MRLLALEHGAEWELMSALAADGTITQTFNKRHPPSFRIERDRLVAGAGGAPSLTCDADGVLRMEGTKMTMRFDAQGALTDGNHMRIYVADSGVVEATLGGGEREGRRPGWRVEGVTPETRRTAELLVFASIASIDWSFH